MIIVGLGNPGPDYTGTRHNVGFAVLDQLAEALAVSWSQERDVLAVRTGDHWLVKPQTYMNRSGDALKDFLTYKNISLDGADLHRDLVVIHDELDFPPGEVKRQHSRSSAGHNGVQSIIDALSTKDFARIRIGIGKSDVIPTEDYVLQTLPAPDRELVRAAIDQAVTELLSDLSSRSEK